MRGFYGALLGLVFIVCGSCADNIKGDAGKDATAEGVYLLKRPAFRSSNSSTLDVFVPASKASPAKVYIKGTVYTNETNSDCNIADVGRGGLDIGSVTANKVYYLYSIPAETGSTFDLVASASAPTTGPHGFTDWSYIGAFTTDDTATVNPFYSSKGEYISTDILLQTGSTNSDSVVSNQIENVPDGIKFFYGAVFVRSIDNTGYYGIASGDTNLTRGLRQYVTNTGNAYTTAYGFIPALAGKLIYTHVSDSRANMIFALQGWVEDPSEYP